MNFPVIAANVEYKDTGKLILDPYAIKEVDGVKIGFIGVATVETPNMVMATGIQDIRFTAKQQLLINIRRSLEHKELSQLSF